LALLVVAVVADAGVFLVVAGGAVGEVQVESFEDGLGVGGGLDLDDDGEVVAFGEGNVGDEDVALFLEVHPGGVGAAAAGDLDGLLADGHGSAFVVQSGDLDFAVVGHEELQVRLDSVEHSAAVGAGLGVLVVVIVIMVVVLVCVV